MSLFEKIECEPIEPEEPVDAPPPSRHRTGETLTVAYKPMMQLSLLVLPLIMLPIVQLMLEEGSMMLEAMAVTAVVMGAWYAGDCLLTRDFTFSPERIVKRGLFGRTVLPTAALKMNVDQQNIRLYHGSDKNFREAVTIRPIRPEDEPLLVKFHETLSDRSVYLRYLTNLEYSERVAHQRLARICFNDYDRELALVAECKDCNGEAEIMGVARLSKHHYRPDSGGERGDSRQADRPGADDDGNLTGLHLR